MSLKILVPTDFSITAEKALRYAVEIASRNKGKVFLYHVYIPLESPFIESEEGRQDHNRETEEQLMQRLDAQKEAYDQGFEGAEIETVLARSPLVGSIVKFAADKNFDLIVMGTQGATGLKKVIVGTIATRIIEKSPIPVLLVPERFEWTVPGKIILATDYNKADAHALAISANLAALFNSSIEVIHMVNKENDTLLLQTKFNQYIMGLQNGLPQITLSSAMIPVNEVNESFETLHNSRPYDLLVMVREQKTFFEKIFEGSSTRQLAYLTFKPLLVIPSN